MTPSRLRGVVFFGVFQNLALFGAIFRKSNLLAIVRGNLNSWRSSHHGNMRDAGITLHGQRPSVQLLQGYLTTHLWDQAHYADLKISGPEMSASLHFRFCSEETFHV